MKAKWTASHSTLGQLEHAEHLEHAERLEHSGQRGKIVPRVSTVIGARQQPGTWQRAYLQQLAICLRLSRIFLTNRRIEGKNDFNSNKNGQLPVPHSIWDRAGQSGSGGLRVTTTCDSGWLTGLMSVPPAVAGGLIRDNQNHPKKPLAIFCGTNAISSVRRER